MSSSAGSPFTRPAGLRAAVMGADVEIAMLDPDLRGIGPRGAVAVKIGDYFKIANVEVIPPQFGFAYEVVRYPGILRLQPEGQRFPRGFAAFAAELGPTPVEMSVDDCLARARAAVRANFAADGFDERDWVAMFVM